MTILCPKGLESAPVLAPPGQHVPVAMLELLRGPSAPPDVGLGDCVLDESRPSKSDVTSLRTVVVPGSDCVLGGQSLSQVRAAEMNAVDRKEMQGMKGASALTWNASRVRLRATTQSGLGGVVES